MAKNLTCFLLCALLVKISYPPSAVLHPNFTKPVTVWDGEPVELDLTASIRAESRPYLEHYDEVLTANEIRQRGLLHEYRIPGRGTPLVVYAKNPGITAQ